MSSAAGRLPIVSVDSSSPGAARLRARLVRRARLLAWAGIGWHAIEAAVAVAAGVVAGSVAS